MTEAETKTRQAQIAVCQFANGYRQCYCNNEKKERVCQKVEEFIEGIRKLLND